MKDNGRSKKQLMIELEQLRRRIADFEKSEGRPARFDETMHRVAEEWRTTIDAVPDSVSLIDPECRIKRTNRATATLLNLSFQKIIGKNCFELFHFTKEPPENYPFLKMLKSFQPETEEFSARSPAVDFEYRSSDYR